MEEPGVDQPEILPCLGGGEWPVQYFMEYRRDEYYIRYRRGWLSVTLEGPEDRELLCQRISSTIDSDWNDEETNLYLTLISRAIRQDRLDALVLPTVEDAPHHVAYRKGPHPLHCVGLVCGQTQSPIPRNGKMNRHDRRRRREAGMHDHDDKCYVWVPANEVEAWISSHPRQHEALKREQASTRRL